MKKNYEKELPQGYRQAFYINAKDTKTGLVLNGVALLILIGILAIVFTTSEFSVFGVLESEPLWFSACMMIMAIGLVAYMVLHELTHGIAYKALTKQKLTFGISWSCAFCGVPNVYVYRRAAIIALMSPFILFTLLLLPLFIWTAFINPLLYFVTGVIFGLHVGGCSGDLYMFFLLIFKFKDRELLMRDTGPEQFLYVKEA